jgi:hypothetical protein
MKVLTHLEHVKHSARVETRLFVDHIQVCSLVVLLGCKRSLQVKLDTFSNLVFEFDLTLEDVRSGPRLGDGKTMLRVGVLGLEITIDDRRLVMVVAGDLECHVGRSLGLDFE